LLIGELAEADFACRRYKSAECQGLRAKITTFERLIINLPNVFGLLAIGTLPDI
jgi:hypothetical protein